MFNLEMSSKEFVCYLRCVATAAVPQEGPSSLVLSVRQAWRCLPCLSTKRTIATFSFPGDAWTRGASGEFENVAVCGISSGRLRKLRGMDPDLPVRVKTCLQVGRGRNFLKSRLGDLLRQLEEPSESSEAAEGVSAPVGVGNGSVTLWPIRPTSSHQVVGPIVEELVAGTGQSQAVVGVDSPSVTDSSVDETDGEEQFPEGWVTFVNRATGRSVRLPAHTKEEKAGRWSGAGAWTAEDDLVDDQAQGIIDGISCLPLVAAQKRDATRQGREQEEWGPDSLTPPGGQQALASPDLESAGPTLSATTGDPEGQQPTMTLPDPSKLSPSPPSAQPPQRPRRQGLWRTVLLTFGLAALVVLLLGGEDSFLDTL